MDWLSSATTVERASNLLKEVNLIYGLVSGVMLKFAFDWSSQTERYDRGRSLMAVGLAFGALTFALVLVALMGGVAIDSLTSRGGLEPTLLVFDMVFVVVLVLLAVSAVAVVRSFAHLRRVFSALRGRRRQEERGKPV